MGDYDKMLTMLTPGLGKIGCSARGARKIRSSLLAGTQFLCFGEYVLYKGNNTYSINSCEPIEVFYNLRTDLDKLKYAVHITKIITDVTDENENCYEILQLFLNTLYTISELDVNYELILSIFKIRLLCILGYRPQIDNCVNCKNKDNIIYFSVKDDGVKCSHCGKMDKSVIEISKATYVALKYIVLATAKKLYNFKISEKCIKEL